MRGGGAERLILELARHTDPRRFAVHVVCLAVNGVTQPLRSEFEALPVQVRVVPAARFYDVRAITEVGDYIRRHAIDIIHTHLAEADLIGCLLGRALGRSVVSTLQNEPRSYEAKKRHRRWMARLTARYLADYSVAVSDRVRGLFIQSWRIPEKRIGTIYNAVPMGPFLALPAKSVEPKPAPLITTVGRLVPQKAQSLLLDAARRVFDHHPTARLMIVGGGVLEQSLKKQARALGIADRVSFAGVRRDIPDILAQTDIFVLSSLWEGLPLSAVEAMAAGCPVVLTDVGGNRELVKDGEQGLIVPAGSAAALAEALLTLVQDAPRRVAMGHAARLRVQSDFSIDTIARQYEDLYMHLLRDRRAGMAGRSPFTSVS
jgi:glycosyltransferase involved in cell wall biosynthesis